jgi:predicted DNA-binding transcriptional regulator AlpA
MTKTKLTTIPESSARLPISAVATRYGVTNRSIDRWMRSDTLNFPVPIYINSHKYWSVSDLETWERELATKRSV